MREVEPVRQHAVDVGGERDAADAAGDRADRVGGELGPHQRHAHHAGRQLVLADRQPGPAQPALAQPQRDEDQNAASATKIRNLQAQVERAELGATPGAERIGRSTGVMPLVPLDRLKPAMLSPL